MPLERVPTYRSDVSHGDWASTVISPASFRPESFGAPHVFPPSRVRTSPWLEVT